MSSRILPGASGRTFAPVEWRRVPGKADGQTAAPAESRPENRARDSEAEAGWAQKISEAHAAGVREGEAAGRNRAAAELQSAIERLARSVDEMAHLRARLRKEAEADVVQLALAIARRVLRREIATDPDALRGLVVAALEKLAAQEISRVRVHPSHAALLTGCLREIASHGTVEVISDGSREPGSVVFETARGNLDASVETQLDEIGRGLADRLRRQA